VFKERGAKIVISSLLSMKKMKKNNNSNSKE